MTMTSELDSGQLLDLAVSAVRTGDSSSPEQNSDDVFEMNNNIELDGPRTSAINHVYQQSTTDDIRITNVSMIDCLISWYHITP